MRIPVDALTIPNPKSLSDKYEFPCKSIALLFLKSSIPNMDIVKIERESTRP